MEADYKGAFIIQVCRFCILISIISATPMGIIPAKTSFSYIFFRGILNPKRNKVVTIGMVLVCYILSLTIPNIGDAIVLVGATVNPFIGFIFPAMYYIKLDP